MSVFISCEQGGLLLPPALSERPELAPERLATQGLAFNASSDASARSVSSQLAGFLNVPMLCNEFSTELIDVRRSLHHRELLGKKTRKWKAEDRQWLIDTIYLPYRQRIRQVIANMLVQHSYVTHLSIQTFDLRSKKGKLRRTDVGLLYDPAREDEVDFCLDWIDEMYDEAPMLKVRRNYPSRGTNDSLAKAMRAEFAGMPYLGIEVWLNRAWAGRNVTLRTEAIKGMAWALRQVTDCALPEAA